MEDPSNNVKHYWNTVMETKNCVRVIPSFNFSPLSRLESHPFCLRPRKMEAIDADSDESDALFPRGSQWINNLPFLEEVPILLKLILNVKSQSNTRTTKPRVTQILWMFWHPLSVAKVDRSWCPLTWWISRVSGIFCCILVMSQENGVCDHGGKFWVKFWLIAAAAALTASEMGLHGTMWNSMGIHGTNLAWGKYGDTCDQEMAAVTIVTLLSWGYEKLEKIYTNTYSYFFLLNRDKLACQGIMVDVTEEDASILNKFIAS